MTRVDALAERLLASIDRWRSLSNVPLTWAARRSDQRAIIEADATQWLEVLGTNDGVHGLHSLLYAFDEFRALYYHRLASGNATGRLLARLMRHIWKPTDGLIISTREIGTGLFIAHGQATCIAAERIGRNCWVHHGVTLGWDYRSDHGPVIGDGVFIGTGAVVLGAITVGDGARIGANAVVLRDVPPGGTAVGSPARILELREAARLTDEDLLALTEGMLD